MNSRQMPILLNFLSFYKYQVKIYLIINDWWYVAIIFLFSFLTIMRFIKVAVLHYHQKNQLRYPLLVLKNYFIHVIKIKSKWKFTILGFI
jgi:hypothetical protein